MSTSHPRLALFTSQFPGRVNTFFARDVRALLDAGIDVDIFPLYPLEPRYWTGVPGYLDAVTLPRSRVHHIGVTRVIRTGSLRDIRTTVEALMRTGAAALRYGAVPLAKTAYAVAKGWAWAGHVRPRYDHVMAYWGNYSATAAYVFHRLAAREVPFSLFLHAGTDLYRQQIFLEEKLAYADHIFVVCEYNRQFIARLYPALFPELDRKITLHHLPLDLAEFAFDRAPRDASHVIAIGSLEPAKGFNTLIRAAARLAPLLPDLRITIVGDGSQRPALEKLISQSGVRDRVELTGWRSPDQVRRALVTATVLVHPSAGIGDAVPTVIKEALAVGTPVVASEVAGIPELLDSGGCGVLVPHSNVDALAAAIAGLLADPDRREQLAQAGRTHAEALFDVRRNGPQLASILRNSRRGHRDHGPAPGYVRASSASS